MPKTVIVTRHAPTVAWLAAQGIHGEVRSSIDEVGIGRLRPGDRVIGPLPLRLITKLIDSGIAYQSVDLAVKDGDRGRELSVAEMDAVGASLASYTVRRVDQPTLAGRLGFRRTDLETPSRTSGRVTAAWRGLLLFALATTLAIVAQSWIFQSLWDVVHPALLDLGKGHWTSRVWNAATSDAGLLHLIEALFAFGLFLAVSAALYRMRRGILNATFRIKSVDRRRVLITGLSRPPGEELVKAASSLPIWLIGASPARLEALNAANEREVATSGETAETSRLRQEIATAKKLHGGFSWQQPIRAVCAHLPVLEHVVVITSTQTKGFYPDFEAFLRGRLDAEGLGHVSIGSACGEVNMEDHDQILASLRSTIDDARERWKVKESDIAIDCTPGSKIFSIAAAVATINRDVTVSYVNNEGVVSTYDGSIELFDSQV